MSDVINTADLFDRIRLEKLWPPGNALCAEQTALLPRTACPKELLADLAEAGLADDDWLVKGDGPCLVLGEGVMGGTGQYYPRPSYKVEDAVARTRRLRAPQKRAEDEARKKDLRRRSMEQRSVERSDHWLSAVKKQQEEEERRAQETLNASPKMQAKRIANLEQAVAALNVRLRELETQLGVKAEEPEPVGAP